MRTYIPKSNAKGRPLGIATFKDKVAQATVKQFVEIIFERVFCDCSYGFRPERSAHDAIDKIEEYKDKGYKWVVDADIKSYFDNIDHDLLMDFVAEHISDEEIEKAEKFEPDLDTFYIATTAPTDILLQKEVILLSEKRVGCDKFPVAIIFSQLSIKPLSPICM